MRLMPMLALLLVSAATLSKEVGATAIGVFAAYDAIVVRGLCRYRRERGENRVSDVCLCVIGCTVPPCPKPKANCLRFGLP